MQSEQNTKTAPQTTLSGPLAAIAKAAQPKPIAAKADTKAAPKAKAAKADKPSQAQSEADTAAIVAAMRAAVSSTYNGPSLAVHGRKAPKLADCIARVAAPVQRANSESVRDASLLSLIKTNCDAKTGEFNPVSLFADIGVLSRLASLGKIRTDGKALFYVKPPSVTAPK